MVDPISAISAAALAAHAVRRTYEFIRGILGAPAIVKTINSDLGALQTVIDALESRLRDPEFALNKANNHVISLVRGALQNCTVLCETLQKQIEPCVKSSDQGGLSKWRSIARFTFKGGEVNTMQRDLRSAKATLEVGISLAH